MGSVLEQEGRPATYVSHKLTVTEQGYLQNQREASALLINLYFETNSLFLHIVEL